MTDDRDVLIMTTFSDQSRDFFTRIQNGDAEGVRDFIDNNQIVPFDNENNESAAAVALKSKQLTVYEALISRGWCLNSNENFSEIVNDLKKKLRKENLEILKAFNQNPNELTSLVDTFLDRNRYVLPDNYEEGKSALTRKIVQFVPKKRNIPNIANQFHEALKNELREIHKRNFIKNPNEEHLTALITRTSIYFGGSSATTNRPKYLEIISGAYEQLNEVPEIRTIFKVVANIKNLDIIFDFNSDSVEHADATGNENVYGRSYAETGRVYLGAKALNEGNRSEQLSEENSEAVDTDDDDKVKRSEVLGVLAHELCYVAMFHIYNNDYKPYRKDDLEGLAKFESVLEHCWENPFTELIIALALDVDARFAHKQLIVRVPHLLALYQEDNDRINSLKETFKKLFDYFEKKTLPDFEKEIELMSAVNKLKSYEPQHLKNSKIFVRPRSFDLDLSTNNVLEISSNCPQITLNWIFQEMTSKANSNFIFLVLNHLKEEETFELVVDAHSSCMKPKIIINCDNETKKEIVKIAEEIKKYEINERIIFVHDNKKSFVKDVTAITVSHSWLDLFDLSKNILIKQVISFQGEKILLNEIVDLHCDALAFVPLKELLDNYLKIGNDLEFPEIDIYVKRNFLDDKSGGIEQSELLNIAKTSKLILLSDDPGMGKTTELKVLAMEFKNELESFWVAFIDLKEHSKFFEKDENFKTEFNSQKEIANFLAKKIFKLKKFEEKVFENLFCCSRVVLLLDGFDEISPSFKKFVTMLIKSIRKHSGNILITSTRPHLKNELCEVLGVEAYSFMPLTEKSCFKIIEKNFKKKGITGKDLEKKNDQTRNFFKNINQNNDLVMNPLLLRMIAKVFSDDQFVNELHLNTFSIYEKFTNSMIEESMNKGHDARQEAANYSTSDFNIKTFYHREACRVLFDYENDFETKKCFNLCFNDIQPPSEKQVTRIGLMKSDGLGKFQFIHRTFAEFLVADFLFKNIFDSTVLKERINHRLEALFKLLRRSLSYHSKFITVRSFIDGAMENLIPNIEVIGKKVLFEIFHHILTYDELPEYFQSFVQEGLLNIITVITRCADNDELKRLRIDKKCINDGNIFMLATSQGSLDFNAKLKSLGRKVLDGKDFEKFFTESDENREIVAYKNKGDVFVIYNQKDLISPYNGDLDTELCLKIRCKLNEFLRKKNISGFQDELEKIKEEHGVRYLQHFLLSRRLSNGDCANENIFILFI